jgi:two-component system, NtrC family, response regulator HydG
MPPTIPPEFDAIVDSMHDGLFLVDPTGTIIRVNEALLHLTGYFREELEGQPCTILGCDRCAQQRQDGGRHWCQLFAEGGRVRQHCHIFTRDGSCLKVLKSSRLVHDDAGDVVASVENVTDISELLAAEQRIVQLESRLDEGRDFCGMVGDSPPMRALYDLVDKAAQSDAAVIIHGESGTGKELVAHAIHQLGPRRDRPFVQINCAAFNESLLDSELFGHVRGAFTGAHRHRVGRFEDARDGDLFLDEVGDIPLPTQVKLLRVLETRRFERVGDNRSLPMDARLISATNQDLEQLIAAGRFRRDFFYRINVIPVRVPPLRDRREDIPRLIDHFVHRLGERTGRDIPGVTPEALAAVMQHDWPGNVRELRSVLEYAFVVCPQGPIDRSHLPDLGTGGAGPPRGEGSARDDALNDLSEAERTQRAELIAALDAHGGNKSAAARTVGVTRATVLNRMRKYGLDLQKVIVS